MGSVWDQLWDFVANFFSTTDFVERWNCGKWTNFHGYLYIVANLGVWGAYIAIPVLLVYFAKKRSDIPFRGLFLLFSAFILFCGTTHLIDALLFYFPHYRLAALVTMGTAIVSWATVFALVPVIPRALSLRTPEELQHEVDTRRAAQTQLEVMHLELERRVEQRTSELADVAGALRESEQRHRRLADALPQLVWICTKEGAIEYLNIQWETYTGRSPESLFGSGWIEVVHPEDCQRVIDGWRRCVATREPYDTDYRILGADGKFRWFKARGTPIYDSSGELAHWFGTCTDIDDQQQLVEERTRLLEHERAVLADVERASRSKDEFLSNLSHELRTPLNAILGWAQLLRITNSSPEEIEQGLETIESNAKLQAELINDLLDMSRIAAGKIRLELSSVALKQVVEEAVESARPTAEAKQIRLTSRVDAPAYVLGDPARLQQVLWNLLSNALKFTPAGGQIEVSLRVDDSQAIVDVTDNGVGIPADFLPYIFERFSQADSSSTRKHGGIGLGLAISKQLIEMHGGDISASSPGADRGATFTIRLPLKSVSYESLVEGSAEEDDPSAQQAEILQGLRVMIVEDDADSRMLTERILVSSGCEVLAVEGVDEALAQFDRFQPALLLSDISMPDRDGIDLIRELRIRGVDVPAAAVTAFARPEDRQRALDAGFQMHIAKPVQAKQLLILVARLASFLPER